MARRSLPEFAFLWQQHESIYLTIFIQALHMLSDKQTITGDENAISKTLCPFLTFCCRVESRLSNRDISTPIWEAPIAPASEDELSSENEPKRPDFTCKLCNPYASTAEEYEISFHVECKLLGNPTSPTWILNKNYVSNGIMRFDSPDHEYGKRSSSGLMIGYMIDMPPEQILNEVNNHQAGKCPHNEAITFDFTQESVHRSYQYLQRVNLKPNDFKLTHLWVDLRHNYRKQ